MMNYSTDVYATMAVAAGMNILLTHSQDDSTKAHLLSN